MFNIRLKEFYIFVPMLIAYVTLGILYPFLTVDIIKFILFQLTFLLLPAYIFSKWFISEDLTKIQRFIFGYPVSMVVIFILSWTGNLLNIKYLETTILIFSIMAIYKIIKEDGFQRQNVESQSIGLNILFYSICVIIVFRMFIIPSSPPTPQYPGLFYTDSIWSVDNTWVYIRGFPLEDSRFAGVPFGYHMLKNIYQATVFKYAKIDPFNIHFAIEPISDWFIMVFLTFWGGIKIAKFTLRKTAIFCIGLYFGEAFLGTGLQSNSFINPLTTYFSITPLVLFVFYIIGYMNKQRKLDIIYLTALYIYFTSTKVIPGIIIPSVLFILFIFNLFKKTIPFSYKQILLGFNMFISVLLLRLSILKNTTFHNLSYDYDTSRSLVYKLLKQTDFIKDYADFLYPVYRFWSSFFRNLPCYLFNWPVLLFCILLFTSNEFKRKINDEKSSFAFVIVFFLVTISMMCLFDFPGIRVYYYWYAQLIFLFLGVFALDYVLARGNMIYKSFAVFLVTLSIIICGMDLVNYVKIGWGALPKVKERIWDERVSISYGEWQGMQWLKQNTDIHQIFFYDRRYFAHETRKVDMPRFYGYTPLSGRQAFAGAESMAALPAYKVIAYERWDLINKFLSAKDPAEQKSVLRDIRADYFVQSLRFNKRDFSKIDVLNLVYENKDIKIYKICRE